MARDTHFLDVQFTPEEKEHWQGNLLYAIHAANASKAGSLRVAFPLWAEGSPDASSAATTKTDAGSLIRIFGTKEDLETFSATTVPVKLRRSGVAQVLAVKEVPAHTKRECFIRDRSFERKTPGERARRMRRQLRNNKTPREYTVDSTCEKTECAPFVVFDLFSTSTGNKMPLYVSRRAPGETTEGNNTYGLCKQNDVGTPVF